MPSDKCMSITSDDAQKISAVLATADDSCPVCARNLAEAMSRDFPEHDWVKLVGDK